MKNSRLSPSLLLAWSLAVLTVSAPAHALGPESSVERFQDHCDRFVVKATGLFFEPAHQSLREFDLEVSKARKKNTADSWNALVAKSYARIKKADPGLKVELVTDSPYGHYLEFSRSLRARSELGLMVNQVLTLNPEVKIHYLPKYVSVDGQASFGRTQILLLSYDIIANPDRPSFSLIKESARNRLDGESIELTGVEGLPEIFDLDETQASLYALEIQMSMNPSPREKKQIEERFKVVVTQARLALNALENLKSVSQGVTRARKKNGLFVTGSRVLKGERRGAVQISARTSRDDLSPEEILDASLLTWIESYRPFVIATSNSRLSFSTAFERYGGRTSLSSFQQGPVEERKVDLLQVEAMIQELRRKDPGIVIQKVGRAYQFLPSPNANSWLGKAITQALGAYPALHIWFFSSEVVQEGPGTVAYFSPSGSLLGLSYAMLKDPDHPSEVFTHEMLHAERFFDGNQGVYAKSSGWIDNYPRFQGYRENYSLEEPEANVAGGMTSPLPLTELRSAIKNTWVAMNFLERVKDSEPYLAVPHRDVFRQFENRMNWQFRDSHLIIPFRGDLLRVPGRSQDELARELLNEKRDYLKSQLELLEALLRAAS